MRFLDIFLTVAWFMLAGAYWTGAGDPSPFTTGFLCFLLGVHSLLAVANR